MIVAVLASGNPNKLEELRGILPDWRIEPLDTDAAADETGATYYANALIKAELGRRIAAPDLWVIGEDSGIECDALEGGPGLHSARWVAGRDQANALLERLEAESRRGARMVSELVCISPTGRVLHTAGVLEGEIARSRRGRSGFGYDPIFMPSGFDATVAELGEDWKRRNSHRARAALALAVLVAAADA